MRPAIVYLRMPGGAKPGQIPSALTEGIQDLLNAEPETIDRLAAALHNYPGFLNQNDLRVVAAEHLADSGASTRIADLLWEISQEVMTWDHSPKNYLKLVDKLIGQSDSINLESGDRKKLNDRLRTLIRKYPAIQRQWKAEQLAAEIGVSLDEVRIVSDLRPVFTEKRDKVEGIFPITFCKLVWTDVDGLPRSITLRLTEEELDTIAKQIDHARIKLKVLKDLLRENKLAMPSTHLLAKERPST